MDKRSLIDCYKAAHLLLTMNLGGIDDAAGIVQPKPGGNCINWIAGHLMTARDSIVRVLGGEPFLTKEETQLYKRGSDVINTDDSHTDLKRLVEGLETTHQKIIAALEAISDEGLEKKLKPAMFPVPVSHSTLGTMLTFLLFHEGYHAGQIGLARRVTGKAAVIQ